ncbi:MAG: hypothetical protein ACRCSQ_10510, partial [Bacteroidales bacterium]
MNITTHLKFLFLSLCIFPFSMKGESELPETKFVKTQNEEKSIFVVTKPVIPTLTPKAPVFALSVQNGKFLMSVGGIIKPVVGWDIGKNLDGTMY